MTCETYYKSSSRLLLLKKRSIKSPRRKLSERTPKRKKITVMRDKIALLRDIHLSLIIVRLQLSSATLNEEKNKSHPEMLIFE